MKSLDKLVFGTAGIPLSTPRKNSIDGIKRVKELGLGAMELEFVRGVKMSRSTAQEVRSVANSLEIILTAHAPYYINLNSQDRDKLRASIERILETARVGSESGAFSIVFHPAYYGSDTPQTVYKRVRDSLKYISRVLKGEGIEIWVRPETMGGLAEFGDLDEVISLAEDVEMVLPAIDFAHLHARSLGGYNTYEEISGVLVKLEQRLGRIALDSMHIHISGIQYGSRGEIKHLNLEESDLNYKDILRALKDFRAKGVVISESPNIEGDAILMRNVYEAL